MRNAPSAHLDFTIIGAMKCGTTSLFDFLAAHPDVCAPRNKEPHYFTRGYRFPARYYRRLFRDCGDGQLRGEASPTYSWVQRYPECAARIATDAPDARIIMIVRDPLDRVLSHLRHQALLGTRADEVEAAIRYDELWERSSYKTALTAYLAVIPRDRIHVTELRALAGPGPLQAVLEFLGLDPAPITPVALPRSNASEARTAVPGIVGRIASTPVGAIVRDVVPRARLDRVKGRLARPVDAVDGTEITRDDLRRIEPDRCAAVEAEYAWVRGEFLAD